MPPFAVRRTFAKTTLKCSLCLALLALDACSYLSFPSWPSHLIYKVDIQQGAVVTKEMAEQLRPGMSREQVRFVLGTPPIADPFHTDRWDYTYRFQPGRGDVVLRHFTVNFKDEKFVSANGDPLPTEAEFIATRIRLNTEQAKASGVGSTTAVVPVDGAEPPPTPLAPLAPPPSSNDSTPASPASVSPAAASDAARATPPAIVPPPPDNAVPADQSPSVWDRVKGLFGSGPAQESKPVAPSAPNGPAS